MSKLGFLEKLDVRKVWEREDTHFTPWLSEENNLKILSDTLCMDLELEAREKSVGVFKADMLCKDLNNNDSWVIIENQLDLTDHKHLGQLITYSAGLKAACFIWIATKFNDEHIEALNWLNKITDTDFKFFGLEIELWTIGESLPAPKFNIIAQPNNWSKTISREIKNIDDNNSLTETKILQQNYWKSLCEYLKSQGVKYSLQTPRHQHWHIFAIGRSNFDISTRVDTKRDIIAIQLNINKDSSKRYFNMLKADQQNIVKWGTIFGQLS